ncbi:MAG TPA: MarR family transcriptional regulator [Arthrobacter sp.]|nr:MarR family transcriptional regulator [Arthrobacter sp.]
MPNPLDRQIDALQRATRDLLAVAMRSVDEVTDLSMPQMRMLFALHDHGTVPSGTLAHVLEVSGSSVTRLADRLCAGGYVQRTAVPENRSLVLLSLTEAGREAVAAVVHRRDDEFRQALSHLSPELREQLAEGLTALHGHLSEASLSRAVVA